tara:strand:+ start:14667 stop:15779 length:1113 start_codon:yes stop_codon:yes gene_type:complete
VTDEKTEASPPLPEDQVEYSVSPGLAGRLARHRISIAITSYQSGLLYFVGRNADGGINVHQTAMPKPMGLCLDGPTGLTMTSAFQIMRLENVLQPDQRVNDAFDACYVPRRVHVTGTLDAHDVGMDSAGRAVFVNTRYNCLATTSPRYSFEVVWKPPFISALVDEDRCHLNGLAMEGGRPRYVTAVSRSDTIDGWRDRRADGGIVIDVDSNEIICTGLSMPHSPRLHRGELWVLNAGTGELGVVDRKGGDGGKGAFEARAFCPGFLRGLAFHGNFAFVGLSKPRYKRFEGLALDQRLQDADSEPWCGVQVIDLSTGSCVDWFRIDGKIAELYDLEIIEGHACPMAVPPYSDEAARLITLPPEGGTVPAGI